MSKIVIVKIRIMAIIRAVRLSRRKIIREKVLIWVHMLVHSIIIMLMMYELIDTKLMKCV